MTPKPRASSEHGAFAIPYVEQTKNTQNHHRLYALRVAYERLYMFNLRNSMGCSLSLSKRGLEMGIGEILSQRAVVSIEETEGNITSTTSIELPDEISSLITGSEYWRRAKENRYRKLIRDGHLYDLLDLAKEAVTKDNPAHWFARVASKAQWERTLDYLSKLRSIAQNALEVARRLAARPEQMKAIHKALWRSGDALRHAITAQETGRDKFKYFCWLVWRGGGAKSQA